jgi:DNA topoisomerase IB
MGRDRVLACAVRLLDVGFFRIGSEDYAEQNDSYGLATMQKRHVSVHDGSLRFDYPAKGGQRRVQEIVDDNARDVVAALKLRRGGGSDLLAYRDGRGWVDVRSSDINDYVKKLTGGDFSAKDFRTWNATVLAAVALARMADDVTSKTSRKRIMRAAVNEVAAYLGNTPAVCRASYIDPRVFDRFRSGWTIRTSLADLDEERHLGRPRVRKRIEAAVVDLIADDQSGALEKVA